MEKGIIKIIIADDHKMFLDGLVAILKSVEDFEIVATVTNGEEVLKLLLDQPIDVVITDVDMPLMDGMKLTKEIKKNYPRINILALTMHNESKVISGLFKQGVTGYILKNTDKDELIDAIKAVAKGDTYYGAEVKTVLMQSITTTKKPISVVTFPELSIRQKEVLKLIAAAYTYQQIAEKLFISENTVIFHKKTLYEKLGVKNTAGLIQAATEKGLLD